MERISLVNFVCMSNNLEFYEQYEERLTNLLVELCTSRGFLDGQLYMIDELNEKWSELAPEYMVDAVAEVNSYPSVAVAWAAYLGMGVAAVWDTVWADYKDIDTLYKQFSEPRGFDEMDEFVLEEMLSLELESDMAKNIEGLLRSCAQLAMTLARKEVDDSHSSAALYTLASTAKVLFRIGISIELKLLGYKYERVKVDLPS